MDFEQIWFDCWNYFPKICRASHCAEGFLTKLHVVLLCQNIDIECSKWGKFVILEILAMTGWCWEYFVLPMRSMLTIADLAILFVTFSKWPALVWCSREIIWPLWPVRIETVWQFLCLPNVELWMMTTISWSVLWCCMNCEEVDASWVTKAL